MADEMVSIGSVLAQADAVRSGSAPLAQRMAPRSDDHERAVLGGILFDGRALEAAQEAGADSEVFHHPKHARIWEAMCQAAREGDPVDTLTVAARVPELRGLVAELAGIIPTSAHVGAYAAHLVELAQKRRVIDALQAALDDCYRWRDLPEIQSRVMTAFDAAFGRETGDIRHVSEYAAEAIEMLENKPGRRLSTGLGHVDEMLGGGLEGGRLYLGAARPGMGKSALVLEIVGHASESGVPVLVVTLEMSGAECLVRLWAQDARVNPRKPTGTEWRVAMAGSMGKVQEAPIWFADKPGASIGDIQRIARRAHRKQGIGLIVIDYLQLMDEGSADETKAARIGDISKGLKTLARELHVPVVCLSQLNRKVEERPEKRPQLSDLRDSGALEQDADVVMLLWRPEYYGLKGMAEANGKVEVQVAKQRNGPSGSVWLRWDGPSFSMSNLSRDEWPRGGR